MNEVAALTLLILLFITAECDHRFLGLTRFLRRHRTVITLVGDWRLCLTCVREVNIYLFKTKLKQILLNAHLQSTGSLNIRAQEHWPLLVLGRPLVGSGVRMTVFSLDPSFWLSSSISGLSTFSSPRVWTAVSRFSNSSTWAWFTHLSPLIQTKITPKKKKKKKKFKMEVYHTLNCGFAPRRSLAVMESRGW